MIAANFDLETIPDQALPSKCLRAITDEIKFGNLGPEKRQEKIDKKMSVTPRMCQVCTFVGMKYDTDAEKVTEKISLQLKADPEDEYEIIRDAWDWIKSCMNNRIPIVSYNGIGFDLPILKMRAIKHDVPIPFKYKELVSKWGPTKFHYDLMLCLADFDRYNSFAKLDYWLNYFGIGQKTEGMDGSQVYPAWKAGEYDKIQSYCEDDVLSTARLFARVESWIKIR